MKDITTRLRRLEGQLRGVEEAISNEKNCKEVVPQLLAIKGALNSAVVAYIEASLDSCIDGADDESMRRLITTLLKQS